MKRLIVLISALLIALPVSHSAYAKSDDDRKAMKEQMKAEKRRQKELHRSGRDELKALHKEEREELKAMHKEEHDMRHSDDDGSSHGDHHSDGDSGRHRGDDGSGHHHRQKQKGKYQ